MKKLISMGVALALVLSFSLVSTVPVMAAEIVVPDDYGTIQDAINSANAGDTIRVRAGTYDEDLVIPAGKDNLVLQPFEDDEVTIKGVQTVESSLFPLAAPNIEVLADGVKIQGFTIQGPDVVAGNYSSGVVIGSANVTICGNDFDVPNAGSLADISQAIQTYHENAIAGVNVSGLSIHDNTFTNYGEGEAGYEGVYVNRDAGTGHIEIVDNEFTGDVVRAITTERSNTTISGNTIMTDLAPGLPGGYIGILVRDYLVALQHSVIVSGNVVGGSEEENGFLVGIQVGTPEQELSGINVTCNTVEMNVVGVKVLSSADGVLVNCNNIVDNLRYGVQNEDDENLDATMNWWGDVSGPSGEGPGTGDAVSENVTYEPWSYTPDPCCAKSMGFWKNHLDSLEAVLDEYGPFGLGSAYNVSDADDALEVFGNASAECGENMLAAQLLAAKLNVAHLSTHLGIDTSCIADAIEAADDALDEVGYEGPDDGKCVEGKDKGPLLRIKDELDKFNNGKMCGCECDWEPAGHVGDEEEDEDEEEDD